jgi:hypothetical protein
MSHPPNASTTTNHTRAYLLSTRWDKNPAGSRVKSIIMIVERPGQPFSRIAAVRIFQGMRNLFNDFDEIA